MTSVCFGIEKVQCQKLNIIDYFFSISYMPMNDLLKNKICKENKSKKNQNALIWLQAYILGDVRVIGCISKVIVPINQLWFCELNWFFHISNHHNMHTFMQSFYVFHTQHAIFFTTLDTCAGTMWFGHHKALHVLMYAH